MPNQIIIEPVADSTKILTHVMGTAEGVIVTRYTDGSDIYVKKWLSLIHISEPTRPY